MYPCGIVVAQKGWFFSSTFLTTFSSGGKAASHFLHARLFKSSLFSPLMLRSPAFSLLLHLGPLLFFPLLLPTTSAHFFSPSTRDLCPFFLSFCLRPLLFLDPSKKRRVRAAKAPGRLPGRNRPRPPQELALLIILRLPLLGRTKTNSPLLRRLDSLLLTL